MLGLHALMFASGGLALVYEILWMRRFAAVFGAATPAVAATLAAVFLGFTTGSRVMGGWAVRVGHPVRLYGWLELGAGVGAVLVEPLLRLYDHCYPWLYEALAGSPAGFAAVKTALAMVALFLPTFCMGGTVPVLGQAVAGEPRQRQLGVSTGGLYAANTFGAALGALSVPFWWLPQLGAVATYSLCVAGSLGVGGIAWWLGRGESGLAAPEAGAAGPGVKAASKGCFSQRLLALLAGFSGATIFVLQVAWERMFAQVHENSIYSFAVVLALLLLGLAGGAAVAREGLRRGAEPRRLLGAAWVGAGLVVLLTPGLFYLLTGGLAYLRGAGGWTSYGLRMAGLAAPTVLVPALLAGIALPVLMELAGQAEARSAGSALGQLLAFNTAGAIAGALIAAFVLPSLLGLWLTLTSIGLVLIAAGELCRAPLRQGWMPRRLLVAGCTLAIVLGLNPAHLPRTRVRADQDEKLVALKEGSHGITAVVDKGNSRRLRLNNYYVLGGTASSGDERLQGHLPLLLHPAPRRVAFLGLGTGITAGAAQMHRVERVTVIEIVPEVVQAARDFFAAANLGIVAAPRTEAITEDARNFLNGSARRFDVIVGDLVVPWRRGEASLYTSEHFAAVRRALAPGGLFCQWLPMFQFSEAEFNIVVATFLDIFPRTALWRGDFAPNEPAVALIGLGDEANLDPIVVERRLHEMQPDAANPFLAHPAGVWMFLVGAVDPTEERFARARRNRENRPWLELLGPLQHGGSRRGQAPLFVGRALEDFLARVRARSLAGSPLARLGQMHLEWRDAGAKLAGSSVLAAEGRQGEADALAAAAVAALPTEIRGAFGPSR